MEKQVKLFAFELAEKQDDKKQWQVREDVSVAGCTDPSGEGDFRFSSATWGRDKGIWC